MLNRARPSQSDHFFDGLLGYQLGYVVAATIVLWLTWGIWSDGPPVGDDAVAHLIRADYAIRNFLLNGRLDGWQPTFALGYQQHLFIGPVLTWLIALIQVASFGSLSTLVAFKVAIVLLFALLPLAVGYLAHSLGLNRQAASIAGLLSLLVNSPFGGFGVTGLFGNGLTVNLPGAVVLCLALGSMVRLVARPSPRRAILTGILFALLSATHGISLILAVALVAIFLALAFLDIRLWREASTTSHMQRIEGPCDTQESAVAPVVSIPVGQRLRWIAFATAVALALAAWIIVPILAHPELRGIVTTWERTSLSTRLIEVWNGEILFDKSVSVLVAIGLVYGLWRAVCARYWALTLVVLPFAFLGLGELMLATAPDSVFSLQIPFRGLGPAGVLAVMPLAALISFLLGPAGKLKGLLGVAISALLVVMVMAKHQPNIRPVTPTPQALAAAEQLRKLVPDGARYAMQRDYPYEISIAGMTHPDFWMAWQSGRNTLNVFNVESSTTPTPAYAPDSMEEEPADSVADRLSSYGVTHVLLINRTKANAMIESPRFKLVWQDEPMAILAVIPPEGQPDPASLLATQCPSQAQLVDSNPEHLRIAVRTDTPCEATAAVAWSPKWRASLNGSPIKLNRNPEGLLAFSLPAGAHTLALDFAQDNWDRLAKTISIFGFLFVAFYAWKHRNWTEPAELPLVPDAGGAAKASGEHRDHDSAAEKKELVLRMLRGEPAEAIAQDAGIPVDVLGRWHERALAAIERELKDAAQEDTQQGAGRNPVDLPKRRWLRFMAVYFLFSGLFGTVFAMFPDAAWLDSMGKTFWFLESLLALCVGVLIFIGK